MILSIRSGKDDRFVQELREALEDQELPVWVDSRSLRGGAKLAPEIDEAIEQARQVIVVLSPNTINSPWVRKEIEKALEIERTRNTEGYRVVPLLLPGIEPSALENWFDEEPVGVPIEIKVGGLNEALPAILNALGERLPTDRQAIKGIASQSVEELILELNDLKIETKDGKRRARAFAQLIYEPADKSARNVESRRFNAQLCAMAIQAIKQGDTAELEQALTQRSETDVSPSDKIMFSKVQAIIRGDRNPALADDPNLTYDSAVELQLLLEAVGAK